MSWGGHFRTNAVDLGYPLFFLQSEPICAEPEPSFSLMLPRWILELTDFGVLL